MRTKLYRFLVVIIVVSFCVTPLSGLQSNVRAQGEIPPPPSPINGPTGGQVLAAPTVLSPSGPIETTTPTFTWTKDTSGLAYALWLYKGSKLIYVLLLAPTTCGSSTCLYTPTKVLKAGITYTWFIEAYEAGGWTSYSYTSFTIALPFYSSFGSTSGWTALNGKWSKKKGSYTSAGLPVLFASSKHSGIYNIYTYEARIMRTGSSYSHGLYFNGSPLPLNSDGDWNSGYQFFVSGGSWSLWRMDSGVYTGMVPWTSNSAIVAGWNVLTVTFNADTHFVQFFINYQLVAVGSLSTYTSGNVGVTFYRDSSASNIYVDYALLTRDAPASIVAGTSPTPDIITINELEVVPGTGGDPRMAP